MKSIAEEVQELRELPVDELVERYTELWGKPPRVKHREWLWKRSAWKLQERRYGGLSHKAKERLEELISEIDLPLPEKGRTVSGALKDARKPGEPPVGSTLTRTWHGEEVRVTVRAKGYEWNGTLYGSLSAVAKAVTGAKWNGKLFFGLTERKRKAK